MRQTGSAAIYVQHASLKQAPHEAQINTSKHERQRSAGAQSMAARAAASISVTRKTPAAHLPPMCPDAAQATVHTMAQPGTYPAIRAAPHEAHEAMQQQGSAVVQQATRRALQQLSRTLALFPWMSQCARLAVPPVMYSTPP